MAKKTRKKAVSQKTAEADLRRKWLAAHRKDYKTPKEAMAGVQKQFGAGLAWPELANILAGKPARDGFAHTGRKGKKKGAAKKGTVKKGTVNKSVAKKAGKRGPGRPKGSAKVTSEAPGYIVAIPGRGRSWQQITCATQAEAERVANEALARGTPARRIAIYTLAQFQVKTASVVSL